MVVLVRLRTHWSKAGSRWTHELVGYALDRFHARNLRTPTVRELRAGVPGLPSHSTICRLYGNPSAMLRAHGYRPRRRGGQPGHPCCAPSRDERGRIVARAAVVA
jgi:hypothetical protein